MSTSTVQADAPWLAATQQLSEADRGRTTLFGREEPAPPKPKLQGAPSQVRFAQDGSKRVPNFDETYCHWRSPAKETFSDGTRYPGAWAPTERPGGPIAQGSDRPAGFKPPT